MPRNDPRKNRAIPRLVIGAWSLSTVLPMNPRDFQLDRYRRQIRFAPLGEKGQRRLMDGRVLIVGCVGAEGQSMAIVPGETPYWTCLMPEPPPAAALPTCETAGV